MGPPLPRSTLPPRRSTVPRPRSTAPPPRHILQPPQATLLRLHPTHQPLPSMTATRRKKARRSKDAKLLMACEASIYEATLILSEYVIIILFNLVDKIFVSFYSSGMMKPVNNLNYH